MSTPRTATCLPLVGRQTIADVLTRLAAGAASVDVSAATGMPVALVEHIGHVHGWPLKAAAREVLARLEHDPRMPLLTGLPRHDASLDGLVAAGASSTRRSVHAAVREVLVAAALLYRLTGTEPPPQPSPPTPAQIRTWALGAGVACGPYGPIPTHVRQAYQRAHRPQPAPLAG